MLRHLSLLLAAAVTITVFFTNCSGFEVADFSSTLQSANCIAKLQAGSDLKISQNLCDSMANYLCERRVFSPDVQSGDSSKDECGSVNGVNDVCVSTRTLAFNTEVAREGAAPEQFEEGGDYNHEEIKCTHVLQNGGVRIFNESGATVQEALEHAIQSCREKAQP